MGAGQECARRLSCFAYRARSRSEALRDKLRLRASEKGAQHLHKILQRLDKTAAVRIHANDVPKVIRAIEVCLTARKPMSDQWEQGRNALEGFRVLRIGLDPDQRRSATNFGYAQVRRARNICTKFCNGWIKQLRSEFTRMMFRR